MNPLRGIGLKILSVMVFTLMAICIKASAPHVPPGEAVFFRSFFAIPVILGLAGRGAQAAPRPRHACIRSGHVWRGLVGTSAMGLGFTALGLLPLPEATALGYAAPLLTVIFAAMFLGEQVRAFRLSAVFFGLFGVVIVLLPRLTLTSLGDASKLQTIGAMAALLGAVFAALAQVFVRKLMHTEATPPSSSTSRSPPPCCRSLTLPFGWVVPTAREAALLVGAGLLGGIGQILLTESYRHAETGVIAPFEYVSMLLALVLGYFDLRGGADPRDARRRRADRRRRALHHLARAQARHPARRLAQGDDAAGLREADDADLQGPARRRMGRARGRPARRPARPVDLADGFVHFSTAAQLAGHAGAALRRRGRPHAPRRRRRGRRPGAALGAGARRRALPASLPAARARRRPLGPPAADGPTGRSPRTGSHEPRRAARRCRCCTASTPRPRTRLALAALRAGLGPRARAGHLAAARAPGSPGSSSPNPLGLAAGFDKNATAVGAARRAPASASSRSAPPRRGRSPAIRARGCSASPRTAPSINRFGFNNDGAAAIAARLAARPPGGVVGLNLGANKASPDRAADYAAVLAQAGPFIDFATVNVSSPNTERLRDLQGPAALAGLLAGVMRRQRRASPGRCRCS